MTRPVYFLSAAVSVILIGMAFLVGDHAWIALGLFLCFPFYLFGFRRPWAAAAGTLIVFCAAAYGFVLALSPAWLLPAACLALLAWDVSAFAARLQLAAPEDDRSSLERAHLTRLGLVGLAVAGLAAFALAVRLELSFEWTAVLVLLGAGALGRLIYGLLQD
ncbi:MAG: hypothetical protein JXB85_12950 [Anaerolineales bacterium]|nr:hypothetical protein [Anaerolineales bacterium]